MDKLLRYKSVRLVPNTIIIFLCIYIVARRIETHFTFQNNDTNLNRRYISAYYNFPTHIEFTNQFVSPFFNTYANCRTGSVNKKYHLK